MGFSVTIFLRCTGACLCKHLHGETCKTEKQKKN